MSESTQQLQAQKDIPLNIFSAEYNKWYKHFLNGGDCPEKTTNAQILAVEQVLHPSNLKQFSHLNAPIVKTFLSFLTQSAPTGINVWLNSMNDEIVRSLADTNQLRFLAVSERMKMKAE